jgi:PAS domain S-box-containing protein
MIDVPREQSKAALAAIVRAGHHGSVHAHDDPFRSFLSSTSDEVWVVDPLGNCTFANPACVRTLGYDSIDQLLGQNMHDLTHHTRADGSCYPAEECRIYRSFREGVVHEVDDEILWRRDGSFFPVRYRSVPVFEAGQAVGAVVVFQDVTESEGRSRFEHQAIGIASHDLRSPISAIIMGTALLLRDDALTMSQRRAALRIHSSAERALHLVHDWLDVTAARLGDGITILPTKTDLHVLTSHVLEEVRAQHPSRDIVHLSFGDVRGEWDENRLAQVVTNLVLNAIQHGPPAAAVRVVTRGGAANAILEVHNSGPPIPRAMVPRLFEPMSTCARSGDCSHSVGLGLYIVDAITRAHGGRVRVESSKRIGGTTFVVDLPSRVPVKSGLEEQP